MSDEREPEDIPSKSARKREAHAAQRLGEQLVGLGDAELEGLGLPERLIDAIREARRITSRAAAVRQRQYIGKLMRSVDTAAVAALLEGRRQGAALEAERFRRIEAWRDRLLAEGPAALEPLATRHPQLDRAALEQCLQRARDPHCSDASRAAASRELFRMLRALLHAGPGG